MSTYINFEDRLRWTKFYVEIYWSSFHFGCDVGVRLWSQSFWQLHAPSKKVFVPTQKPDIAFHLCVSITEGERSQDVWAVQFDQIEHSQHLGLRGWLVSGHPPWTYWCASKSMQYDLCIYANLTVWKISIKTISKRFPNSSSNLDCGYLWILQASFQPHRFTSISGNALPDPDKKHLGCHSYTVHRGNARIEVLLRNHAFVIKCPEQCKGQVTWSRFGGVRSAWIEACTKAGVLP